MVKPEKQEEHTKLMQELRKYMKDNPAMFKELKSMKEYTQKFGGIGGTSIWLIECESLAGFERLELRMEKDEELTKLNQKWLSLIEPGTASTEIWSAME